jgi:hypothetical protein
MAFVNCPVDALPPRSPVICFPSARVSKIAFSILLAWEVRDMWRSIMIELDVSLRCERRGSKDGIQWERGGERMTRGGYGRVMKRGKGSGTSGRDERDYNEMFGEDIT